MQVLTDLKFSDIGHYGMVRFCPYNLNKWNMEGLASFLIASSIAHKPNRKFFKDLLPAFFA
jgi:hypothetical protein